VKQENKPPFYGSAQQDILFERDCTKFGNSGISLKTRLAFVALAWMVSLATTWALAGSAAIAYILYFPLGFLKYLNYHCRNGSDVAGILLAAWIIHIGWSFLTIMFRNKKLFFIFFAILLLLLALDIHGCTLSSGKMAGVGG